MDLSFTPEELAFRDEVRDFIKANLTPELRRAQALTVAVAVEPEVARPWLDALAAKGWVAPNWPTEFGGPGWTPVQRWIFEIECARAGTPYLFAVGERLVGPVIIRYGTQAQHDFFLPRILSGADLWCQGFSEPGAGSDLASLKTRAVRDGDFYVVNGTKIWTTFAHHAERMFALVRTDSSGRKQEGITILLIDMKTPGITIRPIMTIGGDHDVNQVFFDDVRVPVGDRLGEDGQGWTITKYLLEFERGGVVSSPRLRSHFEHIAAIALSKCVGDSASQAAVAMRLSEVEIDIDALEMTELRIVTGLQAGGNPGAISSLMKMRAAEIRQAITRLGIDVIGADVLVWEAARPLYQADTPSVLSEESLTIVLQHLNRRSVTIYGGSTEIQREIIAKHVLGI